MQFFFNKQQCLEYLSVPAIWDKVHIMRIIPKVFFFFPRCVICKELQKFIHHFLLSWLKSQLQDRMIVILCRLICSSINKRRTNAVLIEFYCESKQKSLETFICKSVTLICNFILIAEQSSGVRQLSYQCTVDYL